MLNDFKGIWEKWNQLWRFRREEEGLGCLVVGEPGHPLGRCKELKLAGAIVRPSEAAPAGRWACPVGDAVDAPCPLTGGFPYSSCCFSFPQVQGPWKRAGLRDTEMRKGTTGEGSGQNLHRTSMHVRMYVYVCIYVNVSCSSDWRDQDTCRLYVTSVSRVVVGRGRRDAEGEHRESSGQ